MAEYAEVLRNTLRNKAGRRFPEQGDSRCRDGMLWPEIRPGFAIPFGPEASVFTIGSCFARHIEDALEPLGVRMPTRGFSPGHVLNEYNPGTISRRILDALSGTESPAETIVATGGGWLDLLLMDDIQPSPEQVQVRRTEVARLYAGLADCDYVIVTLGLVECWFDRLAECYINRLPPMDLARTDGRFEFRRLGVEDALPLLWEAFEALAAAGKKLVLTVSPVPIWTTFTQDDAAVADSYSKAVLRICADRLAAGFPNVDYFPSFEIVRSGGIGAFQADNLHVRDAVVRAVTAEMVRAYSAGPTT